LSDPSPKVLCNIIGVGNERPIIVDGMEVNADLVMEVRCACLGRPLRRMLLASCKAAGFLAPTYT
jgi:hypothetical protein